jgi:hypothetical protein
MLTRPAAASAADCTACLTGYRCCCPELSSVEHYVPDTLPLPVCENVRAPRCRLAPASPTGVTFPASGPASTARSCTWSATTTRSSPRCCAPRGLLPLCRGCTCCRWTWRKEVRCTWIEGPGRGRPGDGRGYLARGTPSATTSPISSSPPWAGRSSSRWVLP